MQRDQNCATLAHPSTGAPTGMKLMIASKSGFLTFLSHLGLCSRPNDPLCGSFIFLSLLLDCW
jgi:hypothetical protein